MTVAIPLQRRNLIFSGFVFGVFFALNPTINSILRLLLNILFKSSRVRRGGGAFSYFRRGFDFLYNWTIGREDDWLGLPGIINTPVCFIAHLLFIGLKSKNEFMNRNFRKEVKRLCGFEQTYIIWASSRISCRLFSFICTLLII